MALRPGGPARQACCPSPSCRRRHLRSSSAARTRRRLRRRRSRECWWRVLGSDNLDTPSSSDEESLHPLVCYHSDIETSMPGGFENSAMKSSFSLSSLQPSSASLESPEHARPERPYNSLRKTSRRDPEQELWRRSWDRREETKDEFWNALEPNYLYLMDCNLIDSCKEAGRDLHYGASPSHDWSFEQFCTQFTELDLWLTSIQEAIYTKEENATDTNLRLSHVEEMRRKTYKRKVFNNQGGRLAARFPELKGDVKWRMTHLNRKWERLELTVTPRKRSHPEHTHLTHAIDVEHELNCLRKWLRLTEKRLLPLNFHAMWTLPELEVKAKEHQVIQREVESHGRIVCSVLKRCDRLVQVEAENSPVNKPADLPSRRRLGASDAVLKARNLERRWQFLYIRSLEWLCHIENLTKRAKSKSPDAVSSLDSDEEEPVVKHPRLSSSRLSAYDQHDSQDADGDCLMDVSTSSANDMVGPQSELNLLPADFTPSPPPPTLLNRSGSADEDMINENYSFEKAEFDSHTRRQSVPIEAARKLFSDEIQQYNMSNRSAHNCATFYFKHCDTESEQEERPMDTDSKNMDESSEEEWTYKCGEGEDSVQNDNGSFTHSTETLAPAPRPLKQETLPSLKHKKLIEGAEEIVHPSPVRKPRVFTPFEFESVQVKAKVNDWMKRTRDWRSEDGKIQGDNSDATWEYTTEEEERMSSGDFHNVSEPPSHQSAEALPTLDSPSPSTPVHNGQSFKVSPVVLRAKRKEGTPKRPLSESGLPNLITAGDKLPQYRSESALNQMDQTPTQSVKMDTSVHGTLSSSTTVEETPGTHTQDGSCGGYSTNSLRRRKMRLRKRNFGKRSDSGSDHHDPPSPLKSTPTSRRLPSSGTETEEEFEGEGERDGRLRQLRRKHIPQPMFKLGPEGGKVTVFPTVEKTLSADSSFSEQAWDNYQEKYMSEAYSEETPDPETARRLLEFGEDYGKFLDSQSDCASSLSTGTGFHRRRRQMVPPLDSDSESAGPEVRKLIVKSVFQLDYCDRAWNQLSKANPHLVMAKDFAEIKSTCKENMSLLKRFVEKGEENNEFIEECKEIRGVIEQWRNLELRTEELEKMRSLQREIASLKEEMEDLSRRVMDTNSDNLQDQDHLEMKIRQIKNEQANLRERKSQLLEVNTAVHKFFTDSTLTERGLEPATRLKGDIKDLYYVWDETNKKVSQQLESLIQLLTAWQTLESHYAELKETLRSDQNTLRTLDSAVQKGSVSHDITSSVIDVAKVLSEKQDLSIQSVCALKATTPIILSTPSLSEGPLSDSGFSDSGSEQESERERQLSALRRLARQLESALGPHSPAFMDITRRIELAEEDLRRLQKTCRELIVRTAICADTRSQLLDSSIPSLPMDRAKKNGSTQTAGPQNFLGDSDPDDDPGKGTVGWLWRVIRAALPFQMAILAIFCVVSLLEPRCCESMNNLNFWFTPQLRYTRGPPPT